MSYKITASDLKEITLNQTDTTKSVIQNIALILQTRQQQTPLYRSFGLPGKFIDKPINIAKPIIVLEVKEAIEKFEPRATVLGVEFEIDESNPGRLVPIVEVEINE
jgi:hypothetical protein